MISVVQTIGRSPELSERRGLEGFSPVPYWLTFLKRRATTNFNTFIKSKNELLFTLSQEKIREQKYDKNMDADSLRADHEPVGQQRLFRTPMVHC